MVLYRQGVASLHFQGNLPVKHTSREPKMQIHSYFFYFCCALIWIQGELGLTSHFPPNRKRKFLPCKLQI